MDNLRNWIVMNSKRTRGIACETTSSSLSALLLLERVVTRRCASCCQAASTKFGKVALIAPQRHAVTRAKGGRLERPQRSQRSTDQARRRGNRLRAVDEFAQSRSQTDCAPHVIFHRDHTDDEQYTMTRPAKDPMSNAPFGLPALARRDSE